MNLQTEETFFLISGDNKIHTNINKPSYFSDVIIFVHGSGMTYLDFDNQWLNFKDNYMYI